MVCIISERLRAYWAHVASSLGLEVVDDPQKADVVIVEVLVTKEEHHTDQWGHVATVSPIVDVDQLPPRCVVIGTHVSGDAWLEGGPVVEMSTWNPACLSYCKYRDVPSRPELVAPVCYLLADKEEVSGQAVEQSKSSKHLETHRGLLTDPRSVHLELLEKAQARSQAHLGEVQQEIETRQTVIEKVREMIGS